MKIFITGDRGFVGSYMTKKMVESGHEVIGLDKKTLDGKVYGYSVNEGNILDKGILIKTMPGADCIIHLAAEHHDFGITRDEFFKVNVEGTKNLLDMASELDIKTFIFYSSVAVYGDQDEPTTEETRPDPVSDYGKSKLKAEEEIRNWADEDKTRKVIMVRPAVIFGPCNYANMYTLIDNIYRKRFIPVGKGNNIKSVAYVENIVEATIFLLNKGLPGVSVFNYSDGPQKTSSQIMQIILKHMNRKTFRFHLPIWLAVSGASIFDLLARITRINFPITSYRIRKLNTATHHKAQKIKDLGFSPLISLEEGFRRMVAWYIKEDKH